MLLLRQWLRLRCLPRAGHCIFVVAVFDGWWPAHHMRTWAGKTNGMTAASAAATARAVELGAPEDADAGLQA